MQTQIQAFLPGTRVRPLIEQTEPSLGSGVIAWIGEKYKDIDIRAIDVETKRTLLIKYRDSVVESSRIIYYMVVMHDTHTDPEYEIFITLAQGLLGARTAVEKSIPYYPSDTEVEELSCDGDNGCWFSAQSGCGSFHIVLIEIDVPMV